jgi:hypothetical protein
MYVPRRGILCARACLPLHRADIKPRRVATAEETKFARDVVDLPMNLFKLVCYYV